MRLKSKPRNIFLLCCFIYFNIPTFILPLKHYYEWGSWYVHVPENEKEKFFSVLFSIAQFVCTSVLWIWPFLINLVFLIVIIVNAIKKYNTRERKERIWSLALILVVGVVTCMSLGTMIFLPWFWV